MDDRSVSVGSDLANIKNALVSIWSEALGVPVEQIRQDLPFLSLGGDSLSAMLCIVRTKTQFSIEFDFLDLFSDDSTISELALRIFDAKH